MIAAVSQVECPRCRRTGATPLAADGDNQRYNCEGCGENFSAPIGPEKPVEISPEAPTPRFSHAPIAIAEPDAGGVAARCLKCRKPYERLGKHYDRHVASCDGTPFVQATSEAAIRDALQKTNNNGAAAAELLGIPLRTFRRYTKKFGLSKVFVMPPDRLSDAAVSPLAAAPAEARAPGAQVPASGTAVPSGALKAFDLSVEALKAQRSVLEAEIHGINQAIQTIEKLKGLGGAPSGPFAAGA